MNHQSQLDSERPLAPTTLPSGQRAGRAGVLLGAGLALCACGGAAAARVAPGSAVHPEKRDTRIQHEPCDVRGSGSVAQDANADGRPDVVIVRVGGRSCLALDLNLDGVWDRWIYKDNQGRLLRTESDFDLDGRTDEIALFSAGVLTEQQRSTTLASRLDTWHFYKAGLLDRTERDSNADAVVDQWWEYPRANAPDCPLVHSDVDGDGRPDPGASVDTCPSNEGTMNTEGEDASAFDEAQPSTLTQTENADSKAGDTDSKAEESPQ